MAEQKKQKSPLVAVLIVAGIVAIGVIWAVVKPKSAEPTDIARPSQYDISRLGRERKASEPLAESADKSAKTDTGLKPGLREVIKAAETWGPAFEPWFGRLAPDFTLTDITGRQHKLSDYRGKNAMIVFWASWCGPCRMEIPHLIELRNTIGQEKLAMLAISNEAPSQLTKFIAQQKINYTVFSNQEPMPAPFNLVNSIPCSFFIDPQGKIKLATIGLLSLSDMKAILQAE